MKRENRVQENTYGGEKIKVKHNREKQMTLITSLLFSLSISNILLFHVFQINVSVILMHHNHHHHHQQKYLEWPRSNLTIEMQ